MSRYYIDLVKAALRAIEPGYFTLVTTYEPSGIVRERVFCYEFYHQMRLLMSGKYPMSLNGEIDKRGHVDFRYEDRKNPDFVFHIPGTHIGNTVVIEVKGRLDYSIDELIGDFYTLLTFVTHYNYESGIFILFNHSFEELIEKCGEKLLELKANPSAESIFIITIRSPGDEPMEYSLATI